MAKTKPTKTAGELQRLVTEWVMNTNEFQRALAANPTLSIDVGTPTRHDYNGFNNWELSVVPRAEGYYGLIGAAIIAVGAKYDLGE